MTHYLVQAYRQAPWRVELQQIGFFLLVLVTAALFAGLYLYVSAETAAAGVKIQSLELDREILQRQIASLNTQLAFQTSARVMENRALEMGFEQFNADNADYIIVPSYAGRQTISMAFESGPKIVIQPLPLIKPSYTQSLWDLFLREMLRFSKNPNGVKP